MGSAAWRRAPVMAVVLALALEGVGGAGVMEALLPGAIKLGSAAGAALHQPQSLGSDLTKEALKSQLMESRSSSETDGSLDSQISPGDPSAGAPEEELKVQVLKARDSTQGLNLRGAGAQGDILKVPTVFTLHNLPDAEDVTVVGSWSAWVDHYKLLKKGETFDGVIDLPPGKHYFKFIVDGTWTTSEQFPIENDSDGHANNVIDVAAPGCDAKEKAGLAKKAGGGRFTLFMKPAQLLKRSFQLLLWPFQYILALLFGKK